MSKGTLRSPTLSFGQRISNLLKGLVFFYLAIVAWANWQEMVWRERNSSLLPSFLTAGSGSGDESIPPLSSASSAALELLSHDSSPATPTPELPRTDAPSPLLVRRGTAPNPPKPAASFVEAPKAIAVEEPSPAPPQIAPFTPPVRRYALIDSSDGSANLRASKGGRKKDTLRSGWIVEILEGSLTDDWVEISCSFDDRPTITGFLHTSLLKPVSETELARRRR